MSNNGEIHIFSSETGELTCKFQINPVEAKSLVISQDDKSIFVLQAGDIIRKFSIESKTQQAESTAEKNISSISILHSSDLGLEASYVLGIVENVIKV